MSKKIEKVYQVVKIVWDKIEGHPNHMNAVGACPELRAEVDRVQKEYLAGRATLKQFKKACADWWKGVEEVLNEG